jgi:integrase
MMNNDNDVGFKVTYPEEAPEQKKVLNPNHPKKGSSTKVAAIRDMKDIKKIKAMLKDHPRDFCIFTLGINTNLRASDLTRLMVDQVEHLQPGEDLCIKEKKTGKLRCISLNQTVVSAISQLIDTLPDHSGPLFKSRKGGGALAGSYLNNMVKGWCKKIGLKGNYGAHTLRKTFGYIHRTRFNTDIPTLMIMFNHSSQKQTLDYLGVQPTEIKNAYMKEI